MTLVLAVLLASGEATRYDPGVMEQVVENRMGWGQVASGTDPARSIALLDCDRIGETVWLEAGGRLVGPLTVADCAQRGHRADLEERGWAIDVSYELGVELGMEFDDLEGVRVWDGVPRRSRRH